MTLTSTHLMSIKEIREKSHGKSLPLTTSEVDTIVWQTLKGDEDSKKPRPQTVIFYGFVHYGKIYMKFVINP